MPEHTHKETTRNQAVNGKLILTLATVPRKYHSQIQYDPYIRQGVQIWQNSLHAKKSCVTSLPAGINVVGKRSSFKPFTFYTESQSAGTTQWQSKEETGPVQQQKWASKGVPIFTLTLT